MVYLGIQIVAELLGCDSRKLSDLVGVKGAMLESAAKAHATVVGSKFHRFTPHGISGVVIIAESHLAIHTWPEYGYAAVDIFTCGNGTKPKAALEYLSKAFGARKVRYKELKRGTEEEIIVDGNMVLDG